MTLTFPNLRHLRAFKEVAERRSISAAAKHIHLSQPAVTQAISGLERTFRVGLFERRSNEMLVTPIGEILLHRVQRLFAHLKTGARRAANHQSRRGGKANSDFYKMVSASQLHAFIAIWNHGSFSLAAREIGLSQPSVHRAGRDLEKLAGQHFFHLNKKGVELTPAGEHFAYAVKLGAAELRQALDEIDMAQGQDKSRIYVGSMPLSRTSILPKAFHRLMEENAGVQLHAVDGPYTELLRKLRYGDLDCLIGALRKPEPAEDVIQELLFTDTLKIISGPNHPLANRKNLTLEETLAYPWIAPPKSTPSGQYLYHLLGIENLQKSPVRTVVSSLVLTRGLLLQGNYITLMSERQMAMEQEQGFMVPLEIELPDNDRPIGLTMRRDWKPTITQNRFLELLRHATTKSDDLYLN